MRIETKHKLFFDSADKRCKFEIEENFATVTCLDMKKGKSRQCRFSLPLEEDESGTKNFEVLVEMKGLKAAIKYVMEFGHG